MYNEIKTDVLKNKKDWQIITTEHPTMRFVAECYDENKGLTIRVMASGETKYFDPTDFGYAFTLITSPLFAWWLATREEYIVSTLVIDAVYSEALNTENIGAPCSEERSEVIWSVSYAQRDRDRKRQRYLNAKDDITTRYDECTLNNACFIYSAMYGVPLDLLTNDH